MRETGPPGAAAYIKAPDRGYSREKLTASLPEPFYYNGGQSSYRSEVDQLIEGDPEAVFIPSYVTDFTAVESAGTDDVSRVKQHIKKIANPPGDVVHDVLDGLEALRAGQQINDSGASSAVDFNDNDGKDETIERIAS